MKIVLTICLIFLMATVQNMQAQSVGIGTTTPNPSAALDVSSSNKGFLPPRMSSTQRAAIPNPKKGLMVYDTTQNEHVYFDGGKWRPFYAQNYDSAVVDYSSTASASVNMTLSGTSTVTGNAGFIYDNGGPAGNYLPNSNSGVDINFDDSTLSVKVDIEEMNLELFYDSLFIRQYNLETNSYETIVKLSGTQTGNFVFTNSVRVSFKSNNINNLAGFKIRWGRIRKESIAAVEAPLFGWHIDNKKHAAMGGVQRGNNWHTDSLGRGSLSYGFANKVKGNYSVATGSNSIASGNYSVVMGNNAKAFGDYSTAIGFENTASGNYSVAMGNNAKAFGVYSTAIGLENTASGTHSFALGRNNTASGFNSTAMGAGTEASGSISTALGNQTLAGGGESVAMGFKTRAMGTSSTAMGEVTSALGNFSSTTGRYTIAKGYASTVIGTYNDSLLATNQTSATPTNPLFIVGNGDGNTTRSNAMVVYQSGNVDINGNLKIDNGTSVWSSIPIGFAANRTTTLSVSPSTFTDVLFTTQSADDGGDNYDPATGEFTAPTAGMYTFEASVYWSAGIAGFENIYFYVNGATRRFHSVTSANTSAHTLPYSASFKLNAGDVVKVVAYHTNATAVGISANGNGTYFTGVKVY